MVFNNDKIFIFIFLTFLLYCVFEVKGKSVVGSKERNVTEFESSETIRDDGDEGINGIARPAGSEVPCSKNMSNCEETGGSCKSSNDGIKCECPSYGEYVYDFGCRGLSLPCALQLEHCTETGGNCTFTKYGIITCICPEDAQYQWWHGCQVHSDRCNENMPNCLPTGGTCLFDKNVEIRCKCPNGTVSKHGCQDICDGICLNNGTCKVNSKGEAECECPVDYRGKACEIPTKEKCSKDLPECEETGGTCISNETLGIVCECSKGLHYDHSYGCADEYIGCPENLSVCEKTGGYCETVNGEKRCVCPKYGEYVTDFGCRMTDRCDESIPNCLQTGGSCLFDENAEIRCECPNGTVYQHGCQVMKEKCTSDHPRCEETGGICISNEKEGIICECPKGIGYNNQFGCRVTCGENYSCLNGGRCIYTGDGFDCACEEPYTGQYCEKDLCSENPCLNGGHCKITGKSFKCFCEKPFTGKYCEMDDACGSYPCLNGGQCHATGGDSFECVCDHYYSGKFCEIKLPDIISSFKSFPIAIVVSLCIGSFILGFVLMLCCWLCLRRK